MEVQKCIVLNDKREILLNDEDDIVLSVVFHGETKDTFHVPYPSGGYGGGTLFLSMSEKYLIFSYYSGESEEAFILFEIKGYNLEPVYESGYLFGEDANYIFSDSEEFLFQTLRTGWWCEEEAEIDKNGNQFYKFGEINRLNIRKRTMNNHSIHIYPSSTWRVGVTDEGSFYISKMTASNVLSIIMPWGEETLALPLQEIIALKME